MQNPLVSVIIPNYCHARYLNQRIDSVLAQTYHEFELIILDDCSPDEGASRKVIEQYRDNHHVSSIVYNEENSGSTFKQWDKGINLAKGELIWIAESDDFCEPTLLEVLVREFERDERLTLAYTLLQKVDAEGNPIKYFCRTPCGVTRLSGNDYIRRYMTTYNHCSNASAVLFRKYAYEKMDKLYTTYKAGGDLLFWVEIAREGNVAIVNKRLNYFRQHVNKVTGNSVCNGVNYFELKKTVGYILSYIPMSNMRKKLILECTHYKILNATLKNEKLLRDLLEYWGFNASTSRWKQIIVKLYFILRNRFNVYL